ncbi:MAG: LysR family transcriptional regulator [Oligoflexia bacterium]|nr:LysR family transcriptional regulator [Oligoflexia bacterium]
MKKSQTTGRTLTGKEINWNQVFYFCEVASQGSLKSAGQKLSLSASTLSEHIAQLERDLKVRLFHRHHRKLELTEQGAKLFQQAKQMFEAGLRMLDVVSPLPLGYYPVAIGLVPGCGLPLAYKLIHRFVEINRSGKIRLEHADHAELERGLAESRYDFGFSNRMPERKDLRGRLISTATLGFYVSSRLAKSETARLEPLLESLPLLLCGEAGSQSQVENYLARHGLAPCSISSSDYPGLILEMCLRGLGIAVMAQEALIEALPEAQLRSLRLLRRPEPSERLQESLYALWPIAGERSAAVQELNCFFSQERNP